MNRKAHWERIYTDSSSSQVSWYQKQPTLSLELIDRAGVTTAASIIDVGGGTSTLVDRLYESGFQHLAVLDISCAALAQAKRRLGEAARSIEWFEGDVMNFVAPHRFDVWHDRAVLHFLVDATDQEKYAQVLKQTVAPGGHVIVAAFAPGGPTRCSGLSIVQYDAERISRLLAPEFALLEETSELHITPANKQQKFAYFRLIRDTDH